MEPSNNARTSTKKQRWIVIGTTLLLLSSLIYFNWYTLRAVYISKTHSNFKAGEKLYAVPELFDSKKEFTAIGVYRLIRPINELDIDLMRITDQEKEQRKKKLNTSLKPHLIFSYQSFYNEDLKTAKSAYIGNFIDQETLDLSFGEDIIKDNFCIIAPNESVLSGDSKEFRMPDNYTWANSKIYVITTSVTNQELPSFVK